ncbi:DUF938 domain-containing protein [Jeongeupia naejangsanensis]|uniref:DUF938 domain-containing protein n=1 Tax=Jeongeupia naejangsanensis TaxID=613195 RepID=A0ABS2BPA1_9NEIS|nr:DUF938 domain-containing protein [Jeongeupia naejangsanensis]MBM3117466.1 DUF938 domain-containing protein [Jeongeupia naejangsanensis]
MTDYDARLYAPATGRNRDAILAVLQRVLPASGTVLEIASGSGEHAVHFAAALPQLVWQTSDPDAPSRASIAAWAEHAGVALSPPLALDVMAADWGIARAQALVCINMIHISPWPATLALFAGAARVLDPGSPVCLYGPYRRDGAHTAPSNADFDAQLRARNPEWGVRDLETVIGTAFDAGFVLDDVVAMPANNLSVVLRKRR